MKPAALLGVTLGSWAAAVLLVMGGDGPGGVEAQPLQAPQQQQLQAPLRQAPQQQLQAPQRQAPQQQLQAPSRDMQRVPGTGLTMPDIVRATAISVQPQQPEEGQQVTVSLAFQNVSQAPLAGVRWRILRSDSAAAGGWAALAEGVRDSLGPGETYTASGSWIATVGQTVFAGIVDPQNTFGEMPPSRRNNRVDSAPITVAPLLSLASITPGEGGLRDTITIRGSGFLRTGQPVKVKAVMHRPCPSCPGGSTRDTYLMHGDLYDLPTVSASEVSFLILRSLSATTNFSIVVESGAFRSNELPFRWVPRPARRVAELGYSAGYDVSHEVRERLVRLAGGRSTNTAEWYNERYRRHGYAPVLPTARHYVLVKHEPAPDLRVIAAPDDGTDEFLPGVQLANGCVLDGVELSASSSPPRVGGSVRIETAATGTPNMSVRVRWTREAGASVSYYLAVIYRDSGTATGCGLSTPIGLNLAPGTADD